MRCARRLYHADRRPGRHPDRASVLQAGQDRRAGSRKSAAGWQAHCDMADPACRDPAPGDLLHPADGRRRGQPRRHGAVLRRNCRGGRWPCGSLPCHRQKAGEGRGHRRHLPHAQRRAACTDREAPDVSGLCRLDRSRRQQHRLLDDRLRTDEPDDPLGRLRLHEARRGSEL